VRLGRAQWEVWGLTATVLVLDAEAAPVARRLVAAELAGMDRAASRFRPDSELARVNRAGGRAIRTSAAFARALAAALRAAALTDGAVDPTVGEALELRAAAGARVAVTPARPADWRAVRLDEDSRTVAAGLRLDLGATAKALAADLAAARVHAATACGVLVNLGGDIAVAGEPPAGGWPIRAMDDHRGDPAGPGQTVAIVDGGLATSSTSARGRHILDPASGRPAAGPWRTVSVAAATCLDANTASTAAIVLGADAPGWLAARRLPARLVDHDGAVRTTCGWPAC
jgi:thiamine biosynthesis lipoprotein